MQVLVEILASLVVWAATFALAQFGIEVDFVRDVPPRAERSVERSAPPPAAPARQACPDKPRALLRKA
ncbi:MAG: hypothetical protein ACOY4K_11915 [Pseudomonadota bacterium]